MSVCDNGTAGCDGHGEKHMCTLIDVKRFKGPNRVMPVQKPHRSEQTVETPWEFIDAVEARFGTLTFDLAATATNCKVRGNDGKPLSSLRFGPGSAHGFDALVENWNNYHGNLWLNPPYENIKLWVAKCARRIGVEGSQVLLLIPASVGSNWWAEHVDGFADVHFLSPRLKFIGHTSSYPKDLALCIYKAASGNYECWRWK